MTGSGRCESNPAVKYQPIVIGTNTVVLKGGYFRRFNRELEHSLGKLLRHVCRPPAWIAPS